ncbi:hypothetical protein [Tropicimonas sp. IMCC6043]|uniref:hypothetical protein n=1 Tax=Tropicimonas sp. IMCC6043 TaxID=2510645 RepID=UPI00101E01E5|nr:hypothetical protein EU800_16110 [Tropicimonas sp. IMCC6043]
MKTARIVAATTMALLLGACNMAVPSEGMEGRTLSADELPEGLIANAAPNQNLDTVIIQPENGCYWYQYRGPVETTYLPLRAKNGQPICARAPETFSPSI